MKTWTLLLFCFYMKGVSPQTTTPARQNYRVTTIINEPFVMYKDNRKLFRRPSQLKGFLVDVLDKISDITNATFTYQVVKDGMYGFYSKRSNWTGMVGELQRQEADIAAADLTATHLRSGAVDFTVPFFESGVRILIKKPFDWTADETISALLSPLQAEVWLLTLLMFVVVAVLLSVIGRFSPWEGKDSEGIFSIFAPGLTVHNSLMFAFSSLMWQGFRVSPRSMSGRVLACFWWMYVIFFMATYGANLTSFFLTKEPPSRVVPFTSFSEMAEQTDVDFGFVRYGFTYRYFKNSNYSVERKIFARVKDNPKLLSYSNGHGLLRVRKGNWKYAFIMEGPAAVYASGKPPCDLMVVGESRMDRMLAFACRKGLEFCRSMDTAILKMKADNTLRRLQLKWFSGSCISSSASEYVFNGLPYSNSAQSNQLQARRALTLSRFAIPMILLMIGVTISILTLVGEIFWAKQYGEPRHLPLSEDQSRIKEPTELVP